MTPMARMCCAMMQGPRSGWFLIVPAAALIAVGVLIFVEPGMLVWLAGAVSILAGVVLLVMAGLVRRPGARRRDG